MEAEKINQLNLDEAVRFLSDSRIDEPENLFIFPEREKRARHSQWITRSLVKMIAGFDSSYFFREKGEITGVVMALPPGRQVTNFMLMRHGFLMIPFIMGLKTLLHLIKFLDISAKIHQDHMSGKNHWNIFFFTVNPAWDKKRAGQILKLFFKKISPDGQQVFTHSFSDKGEVFFGTHGFHTVAGVKFSSDCMMRCMVKESHEPAITVKKQKTTKLSKKTGKKDNPP